MNRLRYFFCLAVIGFVLLCQSDVLSQTLKINEFMASNTKTIKDPDYNGYADWIEIYNYGTEIINLKGYYITDLLSQPQKYKFTSDLFIQPGAYLLIWADDKNSGAHTNFKLSASGESIGLYNSSGQVIDTLTFGAQQDDISYGRVPDGSSNWFYLLPSSPGTINLEANIHNKLSLPSVSVNGGFYNSALSITITHPDSTASIRYTIDGSIPKTNSLLYTGPVHIDSTLILKVRAFKEGCKESDLLTAMYFINENTQLPVFSLSTDPDNFFSDTSGIYVEGTNGIMGHCSTAPRNWNQDWERPIDIQFFEKERSAGFSVSAGVQIYGGCTRLYPMKSLAFYFRGSYGFGKLHYQLFPNLNIDKYNNFILRSSGQDWWRTMFRDGMVQTLVAQNTNVDVQSFRPSIVFLNGSYWGIHNIREKYNEHYLNSHYGVNEDSVDLLELGNGATANNGDLVAYNSMMSFVSSNDISIPANYEHMKSIIDIDEYIDYMSAEIYAANGDWPQGNTKAWRERKASGKWRWMLYDTDFTFGGNSSGQYNTNTIELATVENSTGRISPKATLLFRKLLTNSDFKNEFIQRFAAHINTTFNKNRVLVVIDSLSGKIADEIPRHKARWPQSISLGNNWLENIQVMKDFAVKRPNYIRGFFNTKFGLAGSYSLIIGRNNPAWGKVFSNSLEVKNNDSLNVFFKNVPLKLKAVPSAGYHFVRWEGISTSTSPEITVLNNSNSSIKAIFEEGVSDVKDETQPGKFVLSQNYPNPFNPNTTISYQLPKSGLVTIKVFDILGNEIETLVNENKPAGNYNINFDASKLSTGVYIYRIFSGDYTAAKKMLLIK
jgi:hypothetical protein